MIAMFYFESEKAAYNGLTLEHLKFQGKGKEYFYLHR